MKLSIVLFAASATALVTICDHGTNFDSKSFYCPSSQPNTYCCTINGQADQKINVRRGELHFPKTRRGNQDVNTTCGSPSHGVGIVLCGP
ncbi:uncharacterized protein EKO05_0005197 [Ascochyta rabiei]|uniref:uncharacterized protein n=1 Tax=Didymella rabiei TaxID=5454 RepID=UPI002209EF22|nr:uncharacterized protein EKO05_0005197 [Ascochyta rabiei]UPX14722.1 hypothetical protein EKO05_0005197 [Ascochyta rabiei]